MSAGVVVSLAETWMASVSKVTQMAYHSPRSACSAMFAYSSAGKPDSSRMVSGVSGRCGSASRLSPVNPGASSLDSSSSISDCRPARCEAMPASAGTGRLPHSNRHRPVQSRM